MKSSNRFGAVAIHRMYQILMVCAPAITLGVNPWTSYDPISLPKMLILSSCAFALGFIILSRRREVMSRIPRNIWLVFLVFSLWLIFSLLFSGAPKLQQFWGSFGRNTGLLTYVSLLIILIATALLGSKDYYSGLTKALVGTALPMTIYCLVQMAGRDPIGWSEFATFGTLGNVNFLSAFFGMTSIACLALALNRLLKATNRSLLVLLAFLDIYIAYSTGSIQGVIIFVAGLFSIVLIRLRYFKSKLQPLFISTYLVILVTSVWAGIFGLLNKGPLAPILYQQSLIFRMDYIHAGWEMTLRKPIFGVGLDSYGDWYREARGEISTLRTGVDRISNSAHNIFLDVSSNGGVVLGITFLTIVLIAFVSALRYLKSESQFDPYFAAIASVWFAYQVQALVSINQIGVGVWGWLLSGALIGYGQLTRKSTPQEENVGKKLVSKKSFRGAQLSARDSVAAISGFVLGILVSAPPVSADIDYRSASLSRDISRITSAVNKLGGTQFHKELALDFALRSNREVEVGTLAKELVSDYPRNFFGWRVLSVLSASTPADREFALNKARALDPYNPELG